MVAYSPTVPTTGAAPANQYLTIQSNFASIQTLIDIDHVDFALGNFGTHKRVTFSAENAQVAPTDPSSILFTRAGSTDTLQNADLTYINQNSTFPAVPIKAYAVIVGSSATISSQQSFNVNSVASGGLGIFNITLKPGAINSTNFGVLLSVNSTPVVVIGTYNVTGANVVQCIFTSLANVKINPTLFTIACIQI